MSEERRFGDHGKPRGGRPGDSRPGGTGKSGDGKPRGGRPKGGKPSSGNSFDRNRSRGGRSGEFGGRRERDDRPRRDAGPRHDDPIVPEDVQPRDLDAGARVQLKTLTKENADWVACHLVMAGRLIDEDPQLAHRHALSASRKAGRVALVRETVGLTAYAIGDFALALRELRTFRRISGSDTQIPVMVDCERGLGRPQEALELGRAADLSQLDAETRVELAIAMSGARLDLGQDERALEELQIPELDKNVAYRYSPRLFRAYAEVLSGLGDAEQAADWLRRAEVAEEALGIDEDGFPVGEADSDIEIVDLGDEPDTAE